MVADMAWIPYPRGGTSFGNGRWLCTVVTGGKGRVEILKLRDGVWCRRGGRPLSRRETVIAVDYLPQPLGLAPAESLPARVRAILGA